MTGRRHLGATSFATAAKIAVAGLAVGLGALTFAVTAGADPEVPPLPPPTPGAPPPAPGQPIAVSADEAVPVPVPPPVGEPPVPEIQNPAYGQGSRSGPLGFLRDAWNQAKDPFGSAAMPPGQAPVTPPPPGAGPPPQLPPGYTSLTAPESNGPPVTAPTEGGGPPLPPGYYSLDGPPPPGYFDTPAPDPAAPPAVPTP